MTTSCFHGPSTHCEPGFSQDYIYYLALWMFLPLVGRPRWWYSRSLSINVSSDPVSDFPWTVWIVPVSQSAVTWENGLDAFREGLEELLQYTLAVVFWGTFLQDLATSIASTFWVWTLAQIWELGKRSWHSLIVVTTLSLLIHSCFLCL